MKDDMARGVARAMPINAVTVSYSEANTHVLTMQQQAWRISRTSSSVGDRLTTAGQHPRRQLQLWPLTLDRLG
jgi:hypothetical protein